MKRRMRITGLLGLTAVLVLTGSAQAGGHRGGRTYVYNGSRGYYVGGGSGQANGNCAVGAPYATTPVAYTPTYAPTQAYYAPQPAYAMPQTQAMAVPQR